MATTNSSPKKALGSVLVVGGCGFLGHHIVRQLLESYIAQVSVLDLQTTRNRFPKVSYHAGDITSAPTVTAILSQIAPAIIIHTASPPMVTSTSSTALFEKVNIEGTRTLLTAAAALPTTKAFIYTSSASVIHDGTSPLINASEAYPLLLGPNQPEPYSATKAAAEALVLAANRSSANPAMLTAAIRPAGIFGEGDVQLIPPMITAYEKGLTRFQIGDNSNLFDYTYVGNAAHAHILAAIALLHTHASSKTPSVDDALRVDGEAFLVTNDSPVYFWDFPRMVWAAAGDKTEVRQVWVLDRALAGSIATILAGLGWVFGSLMGGWKPNLTQKVVDLSCMSRYYSIEKAKRRLGYRPLFGMEESIRRSMEWFLEGEGKQIRMQGKAKKAGGAEKKLQ